MLSSTGLFNLMTGRKAKKMPTFSQVTAPQKSIECKTCTNTKYQGQSREVWKITGAVVSMKDIECHFKVFIWLYDDSYSFIWEDFQTLYIHYLLGSCPQSSQDARMMSLAVLTTRALSLSGLNNFPMLSKSCFHMSKMWIIIGVLASKCNYK